MTSYFTRMAPVAASVTLVLVLGGMLERTPTEARVEALEAKIALLESRVNSAGSAQQPPQQWTVKAPFTVVDNAGKPVFMVRAEPRGMIVVDAEGNTLVAASALPGNGFVKAINVAQNRTALISADASSARLLLRDAATTDRLLLTVAGNGRPTVTLNGDAHQPIVQLQTQVANGGGELVISDAKGKDVLFESAVTEGAVLKIFNPAQTRSSVLGVDRGRAAFLIRDGQDSASDRAVIGVGPDGKTSFRVWNAQHGRILEVAQEDSGGGRLHLYDPSGNSNVTLGALHFGGYFRAQTPDGSRVAILGTEPGNALVALRDGSKNSRATLVVGQTGRPEFALFNSTHNAIVNLAEDDKGTGRFQLFSAGGTTTVEAGTQANGRGTVRVGPQYKCVPANSLVPTVPDCIVGKIQP